MSLYFDKQNDGLAGVPGETTQAPQWFLSVIVGGTFLIIWGSVIAIVVRQKKLKKRIKIIIVSVVSVVMLLTGIFLIWYFYFRDTTTPPPSTLCTLDCLPFVGDAPPPIVIMTQQETEALAAIFTGAVFERNPGSGAVTPGEVFSVGTETMYGAAAKEKARGLFDEIVKRKPAYKSRLMIQVVAATGSIAPDQHATFVNAFLVPEGGTKAPVDSTTAVQPDEGQTMTIIIDKSFMENGRCPICAGTTAPS